MEITSDYISKIKKDLEIEFTLKNVNLKLLTTWGLFSPREIDKGSKLLLECLSQEKYNSVLDLGCGYGVLGLYLAKNNPNSKVLLTDKDFVAVEYTSKNISQNKITNATTQLSNGHAQIDQKQKFDLIVSNIPAKVGKELLHIWLYEGYQRLEKDGKVYFVVISGLREFLKRNLKEVFGNAKIVKTDSGYSVIRAERI